MVMMIMVVTMMDVPGMYMLVRHRTIVAPNFAKVR